MKRIALFTLCFSLLTVLRAQTISLDSPDGNIRLTVRIADQISYSVHCNGKEVLTAEKIALRLAEEALGEKPRLSSRKTRSVQEELTPVVPLKFSTVTNHYNELSLSFKGNYKIEFRAYDDGVAYRFITDRKSPLYVTGEDLSVRFPAAYTATLQQPGGFKTAYEEVYAQVATNEWRPEDKMAILPMLIDTHSGIKLLISETDLADYPCMYFRGDGENGMCSLFPSVPLGFGEDGDRSLKIVKEADYIAETSGKRGFPWRYFVIMTDDKQIIENTMTYKLAAKNQLADTSWIRPGQASWEWWNGATPYGPDVEFVSGFNLDTYKYFIDFAAKYGIEYIIMDEGWALSTRDPYTPNPDVDVHEIIRYGKEKNVGVFLWLTWLTVENNFELFKTFEEWGVKGVKIDFMDRSDQWMVNYYEKVSREAAKHHLLMDFHGSFKPAGLEYAYPNVISYEGVRGMEQMGGCYPDNSLYLPFIRNAVGPMDYTPGAMISMQPDVYRADRPNSASIGTRAYQLALFVVFESGLQMLADNPTLYYRNADCTEFITRVPTTWDETIALEADAGQYIIVAKRKGEKWFIGGITNNKERAREFEISLDFLPAGKSYQMTWFEDGINADRQAMDYRKKEKSVRTGEKIAIKMVRNGGWAAVIE